MRDTDITCAPCSRRRGLGQEAGAGVHDERREGIRHGSKQPRLPGRGELWERTLVSPRVPPATVSLSSNCLAFSPFTTAASDPVLILCPESTAKAVSIISNTTARRHSDRTYHVRKVRQSGDYGPCPRPPHSTRPHHSLNSGQSGPRARAPDRCALFLLKEPTEPLGNCNIYFQPVSLRARYCALLQPDPSRLQKGRGSCTPVE